MTFQELLCNRFLGLGRRAASSTWLSRPRSAQRTAYRALRSAPLLLTQIERGPTWGWACEVQSTPAAAWIPSMNWLKRSADCWTHSVLRFRELVDPEQGDGVTDRGLSRDCRQASSEL